jgi:hypothetical protein
MQDSELIIQEVELSIWKQDMDLYNVGLFNTWHWVNSLTNDFTTDVYYHFLKEGQVVGKMAGFVLDQGKLKGRHLYFTSGPGMKVWSPENFKLGLVALRRFAIKEGFARVHVRPFEQEIHEEMEIPGYFHTKAKEYVVNYAEYPERVKLSFGFKQNAKKAVKVGAIFKTTRSPEVLDRMFELMDNTRLTRKRKYGHNYDPMYLLNLNRITLTKLLETQMGIMHYAEVEGVIHSVQFNLELDGKIFALLMGSDDFAYKHGIPSFIDRNISTKAHENGAKYYNLGAVPLDNEGGEGLKRYKESQGAKEILRYGYYTYFLTYPYKMLNPLVKLSKRLPNNIVFNFGRRVVRLFNFS